MLIDRLLFSFLMLVVLIFPMNGNYHIYFLVNIIILLMLTYLYKIEITRFAKIIILLCFIYIVGRLYFYVDTGEVYIRDFYELGRFFLIFMILILGNFFKKLSFKFILLILSFYVLLDFGMTLLQVFVHNIFTNDENFVYEITKYYSASYHFNGAYFGNRATGFSPGPGQHGQIMAFMFVLFFVMYLVEKKLQLSYYYLAISFISFGCIIFAKSRTAIVALVLTSFLILIWSLYVKNKKNIYKILAVFGLISFTFLYMYVNFYSRFHSIFQVFERGINVSSYDARLKSYSTIFEKVIENVQYLFLGYGKEYFGQKSGSMDSDLLYFITVYGVLISTILLYFIMKFFINSVKLKEKIFENNINIILLFMILTGIIMSYPSSFFIYPVNLILFGILIVKAQSENPSIMRS